MAKVITYKYQSGESLLDMSIECGTQATYDVNYPIAEREAVPGTIAVSGEFDPETEEAPTNEERITELEESLNLLLSGVTE